MRIALIAPLHEPVPPRKYGGTERIVSWLAETFVEMGHEIDLYAAGGSVTRATLVECWPMSLREDGVGYSEDDLSKPYGVQVQRLSSNAQKYDVIHIHHGTLKLHLDLPDFRRPLIWTDHGLLNTQGKPELFTHIQRRLSAKLTAISNSQQRTLPQNIPCFGVVHNGIPKNLLKPLPIEDRNYLAFVGRVDPQKGIEDAIDIARQAHLPLKIAAKVDDIFRSYYESKIEPLIQGNDIDFVGEISDQDKSAFFSGAVATLFPVKVEEPFGLVMIESFACGAPVVGYRRGAVSEVIVDGLNGFIVENVAEAIPRVKLARSLDRIKIREEFEHTFTANRMAEGYLSIYKKAVEEWV